MNRQNAIVLGIVAVVIATITAATCVLIFAPDADVMPIIGIVAPTVAALACLGQVRQLDGKVAQVDRRTTDLSNGLMDAKVRAAVADVVHPDALNPDALEQIGRDRVRRDTYHADHAADPVA